MGDVVGLVEVVLVGVFVVVVGFVFDDVVFFE